MPVKAALKGVAVFCLVGVVLFAPGCATVTEMTPAAQFPRAPDLPFVDVDGATTTLADYAGKSVLVVNFWGLRCQNCIEEMPFLERLHDEYSDKGLVILGINTDGVPGDLLKKFLPQLPLTVSYPLIVDTEFALADGYLMMAAPLTILIGKDGTIRYRHEGYDPSIESHYIELIENLLAE